MAKETIPADVYYRLRDIAKLTPENMQKKLVEFVNEEIKPKKLRTMAQNSAIHVDCRLIADKLNDAGYDMKAVIKKDVDIPWTTESVKSYIWKPIMIALYQKDSTTKLDKTGEIDKIHEVIMRELGTKFHIEWHDFPHDPRKKQELEEQQGVRRGMQVEYPEGDNTTAFD